MQNTPTRVQQIRTAVILWVVVTVVLEAIFLLLAPHLIEWTVLPAGASDRSGSVNSVLAIFTVLSIPVFTLVVVFAIYSVFKNGSRVRPRSEGPAVVVNPRLQAIWIVVSVVLVVFLYFYGLAFLNEVSAAPTGSNVLHITVTGEQWLWDYTYTDPQYGGIQTSVLELPVNVPVVFTIHSIDVQHSFWIPAFAIKQDAVPGETTSISATPNQIGDYVVRCAELCGLYHAYMETPVHVVSMAVFTSWAAQQPTPVPSPSSFAPPDIAFTGNLARYSSVAEG
jgi:cytochrome c oxidase subunit 2